MKENGVMLQTFIAMVSSSLQVRGRGLHMTMVWCALHLPTDIIDLSPQLPIAPIISWESCKGSGYHKQLAEPRLTLTLDE